MSVAKDIRELRVLEKQLFQAQAELRSLPTETLDPKEVEALAAALSKETKLKEKVTAAKDRINSTAWRTKLTAASSIKPVPIHWLWPQWIALGKLTILAGAGGTGKTTMALSLAATLTSGNRWPDDTVNTSKGNVIVWSSEDDHADTLTPRPFWVA